MKISQLIPAELPPIVIRTLQGLLTEGDRNYLKNNFKLNLTEAWFCEEGYIQIEYLGEDGFTYDIDLRDGLDDDYYGDTYPEAAYYRLLAHAASQLPKWVFDYSEFCFDYERVSGLAPDELEGAHDKVWGMLFNGDAPGWRTSQNMNIFTALDADIYRAMHNSELNEPLPGWIIDGGGRNPAQGTAQAFPICAGLLKDLAEIYQEFCDCGLEEEEPKQAPLEVPAPPQKEIYVSPFSGKLT